MKHIHYIIGLFLTALPAFCPFARIAAEGIRIVPRSVAVRNDSLHLLLDMDLNSVQVNSLTAVYFTPVLQAAKGQNGKVELPPVIITGSKRFRYERRERALAVGQAPVVPYLVLLDTRRTGSKNIKYRIAFPYASWMQNASLLLRQDIKDCCDLQLLGVDTLTRRLMLKEVPQMAVQEVPQEIVQKETTPVAVPQKNIRKEVRAYAVPHQVRERVSGDEAAGFASMVSYLKPEANTTGKRHTENAVLYFDYPLGKDDIYPDYKNNRAEIDKIYRLMAPLRDNRFTSVARIRICGYSSPDGPYGDNERLAKARSERFSFYLRNAYDIPRSLVEVTSVAEDWEGLADLLVQKQPLWKDAAMQVISRYSIFGGREKKLMELQGGAPYKEMMRQYFPKLRRIEVVVQYDIRKIESDEAAELIYTHPDMLSLEEMYAVAAYYRPGTDQYREVYEVAAFHFPDDVVANVNAASAVMLTGDLQSAWNYLRKVEADPRAWNNMGVLTLMEGDPEGAAVWFRKAVGVEPRKARRNLEKLKIEN